MKEISINIDQLSAQAGLPSYILEDFERIGLFEESERDSSEVDGYTDSTLSLAKQIASMRGLGFTFDQIIAILEQPEN